VSDQLEPLDLTVDLNAIDEAALPRAVWLGQVRPGPPGRTGEAPSVTRRCVLSAEDAARVERLDVVEARRA